MFNKIREIYQYKELLVNLTIKELKLKYRHSALGFLWSLLNPLMMLVIYIFAFKLIFKIQIPQFPLFVLIGLLPWTFFQTSLTISSTSIIHNSSLIRKVYFPREIIPLSIILSNFINFLITIVVIFFGMLYYNAPFTIAILVLPVVLLVQLLFVMGFSLILSAYTVTYRDMAYLIEVVFIGLFYLTPIVYPLEMIPSKFKTFILINPMASIIESYRRILLNGQFPSFQMVVIPLGVALLVLVIGQYLFNKKSQFFAEEV